MNHPCPVKLILRKCKSNQCPLNAQSENSGEINWVGFLRVFWFWVCMDRGTSHVLREQSQGGWLAIEKYLGN